MKILSEYMIDPFGVELSEPFEIEVTVLRNTWDGDLGIETIVSVDFFELVEGVKPLYPQKNRVFNLPDIQWLTDAEIIEKLYTLVPELK